MPRVPGKMEGGESIRKKGKQNHTSFMLENEKTGPRGQASGSLQPTSLSLSEEVLLLQQLQSLVKRVGV